jgi:hypothetical protein
VTTTVKDATAMIVVAIAIVAGLFVSIPYFLTTIHRSASSEATTKVRKVSDGSVTYFAEHAAVASSSPPTPGLESLAGACRASRKMQTTSWGNNETWRALQFAVSDPHLCVYQYDSTGVGNAARFNASAFGDLDCDGVLSTLVRFESVIDMQVRGSSGICIASELV